MTSSTIHHHATQNLYLYIVFFSTEKIDKRLGYFQNKFNLHGNEVRALATKQPKIITYSIQHINTNTFVINEEMGFNDEETKKLLLNTPKIWMLSKLTIYIISSNNNKLHTFYNYVCKLIDLTSFENCLLNLLG